MNVAIVGSRGFQNAALIERVVRKLVHTYPDLTIISGGAAGADSLGAHFAEQFQVPRVIHLPEWERYGRSAGYKRNMLIVNDADFVIAFFADGPKSRGTQHSVDIALAMGKRVHIYHEGRWEHIAAK